MLTERGAQVIDLPALEICEPKSWEAMDSAIATLHTFDWLILTSPNAVNYFCDRLLHNGKDLRALSSLKIAVVGQKTNGFLKQRGLAADFVPTDFIADSLTEQFPENPTDKKLLFPRVEKGGRDILVRTMTERGAIVTEVAAYESACPKSIPPTAKLVLENSAVDAVTFASSKTVRNFAQLMAKTFGEEWLGIAKGGGDRLYRPANLKRLPGIFWQSHL